MPERWGTNADDSISAPTRRSCSEPGVTRSPKSRVSPPVGRIRPRSMRRHVVLPGAVGAEQAADLTLLDGEAQVVDREHARAEALREADDLDDGFGHRPRIAVDGARGEHCGERSVAPDGTIPGPPAARRRNDAASTWPRRRCRRARSRGSTPVRGFVDRVVGTLWWHERFPERDLGNVPRLRPGNGARQAFYREEDDGPTITLPRRYRTKAVVLHELTHWALGIDSGLPHHGRTFARVLLDAIAEFCGPEHAAECSRRRTASTACTWRARRASVPTAGCTTGGTSGCASARARLLAVSSTADGEARPSWRAASTATSVVRRSCGSRRPTAGGVRIPTKTVWSVRDVG